MLAQWLKASCCGAKPIATAALGQKAKYSLRADVVRSSPNNRREAMQQHVGFVPNPEVKRSLFRRQRLHRIRGCRWSRSRTKVEVHAQLDRIVLAAEGVVEGR